MASTTNSQRALADSVLAPSTIATTLADADIASFKPRSDALVEDHGIARLEVPVAAAPRTFTLVDADIDALYGAPALGTFKTFHITNRGASTVTLAAGGAGEVAAGQGSRALLTATNARFCLTKLSAVAPKWTLDRLYTNLF